MTVGRVEEERIREADVFKFLATLELVHPQPEDVKTTPTSITTVNGSGKVRDARQDIQRMDELVFVLN